MDLRSTPRSACPRCIAVCPTCAEEDGIQLASEGLGGEDAVGVDAVLLADVVQQLCAARPRGHHLVRTPPLGNLVIVVVLVIAALPVIGSTEMETVELSRRDQHLSSS